MSRVQEKDRKRPWPKPTCDICGNPIEKKQDVVFTALGAGIEHVLCRKVKIGTDTPKSE